MISKAEEQKLWGDFYTSLPRESYLHDYFKDFGVVLYRAMQDDMTLDVARLVYLGEAAKENIEAAMKLKDRAEQAAIMSDQQVSMKKRELYELNGHLEAVERDLDYERDCEVKAVQELQQFKETVRQALNTPEVKEAVE